MKEPWSIKSRSKSCTATETPFEDGQTIFAALFPDPDSSGYLRRDYSESAWKEREQDPEAAPPFSQWRTVYKAPVAEEKAEDVVQEDPETLLRRLIEEEEEHTENARYILAVMLERQKILRETDTQTLPTGILRVYEHRKTGDVFIIKDPQIPLSDVEKIQEEIQELLDPKPLPEEPSEASTDETAKSDEAEEVSRHESAPSTAENEEAPSP